MDCKSTILSVYNSAEYQQLKEYYGKSTLFSALGIERSENRHSAFIAWLLNASADHKLGGEGLKKLLGLYAIKTSTGDNSLKTLLITGNYRLLDVDVATEVPLARYGETDGLRDKLKRLDIACTFTIVPVDADNEDASIKVLLVIENKVYSKVHHHGDKPQTQIYHDCLSSYCKKCKQELFEVFLTPDESQNPECESYCRLTYQELLDSVIAPLSHIEMDDHTSMLISDYIRNLGVPAFNSEENTSHADDYTIMATSVEEISKLKALYDLDGFSQLFAESMLAKYESQAFFMFDGKAQDIYKNVDEAEKELLSEFWDANVNIFKAVVRYVAPFKSKDSDSLFRKGNRDNTKYLVEFNGQPVFPGKLACSKTMSALAIFHAYVKKHKGNLSLQDMNKAFPCEKINGYYFKNYYRNLFYPYSEQLVFDCDNALHDGNHAEARWDFHVKEEQRMTIGNGTMQIMAVKMWRKGDFDSLLNHLESNPDLFEGIQVKKVVFV